MCKSCRNALICPECAISGCHRHHNVVHLQQEGKVVKTALEAQLLSLTHKVAELRQFQSSRLVVVQERKNELEDLRCNVRQQYEDIREQIRLEEASILSRCD